MVGGDPRPRRPRRRRVGPPPAQLVGYRKAWWATASSLVALTAVLASWVAANSAGASVANHGPRRSQEVAITFDGSSDNVTLQRLVGILNDDQAQATFFVPAPVLQATPQVGTLVLSRNQLLANEAGPHDWGAWLDPGLPPAHPRSAGLCPKGRGVPDLLRVARRANISDDGRRRPPARHDHRQPGCPSQRARGLGRGRPAGADRSPAGFDHRPSTRTKGAAKTMATSTVVQAVPEILEGLQLRGLHPVLT